MHGHTQLCRNLCMPNTISNWLKSFCNITPPQQKPILQPIYPYTLWQIHACNTSITEPGGSFPLIKSHVIIIIIIIIIIVCFTVQQWMDVEQDKEDKMRLYSRSSSLNPLALNWLLTTQIKVK